MILEFLQKTEYSMSVSKVCGVRLHYRAPENAAGDAV
nr:MAG TPA: hypothetical protein [Inoviridae sp.]